MSLGKGSTSTLKLLDRFVSVLGSTKSTFFPFLESHGDANDRAIRAYRPSNSAGNNHFLGAKDEAAYRHLESEFAPVSHAGGVYSYHFFITGSQYLLGEDSTDYEFGDGTNDSAFSVGLWVSPDYANMTLMAKWDVEAAAPDREWKLALDGSNNVQLSLYDESATASEVGTSSTALTRYKWSFVVATYDGAEADPGVTFYLDGAADGTGTTETNAYVAMEAGAEALTIGAHLDTNAPAGEFDGRLAMPFVCGKELSATEVTTLYGIGRTLMGI